MSDLFKLGDRVQWVGEHESPGWDDDWGRKGDTGTVVSVGSHDVSVRVCVDRSGRRWSWPVENTATLTPAPDTITIDTLTLTLDQARRAGEAAAAVDAHRAAATDRIAAIRFKGVEAIRVRGEQVRRALKDNLRGHYLYLWESDVSAHNGTGGDTLLLGTPALFERLRW